MQIVVHTLNKTLVVFDNLDGVKKIINQLEPSKVLIVSGQKYSQQYAAEIIQSCIAALDQKSVKSISLPSGEAAKDLGMVKIVWNYLVRMKADRHTAVIAVGGGSISDAVGFAASTYMRGLPFVIVPTTLLSMVDASIGGKTAIDFSAEKNLIGTFYPADAVLVDTSVLKTLPDVQVASGFSEALKTAFLEGGDFLELTLCSDSEGGFCAVSDFLNGAHALNVQEVIKRSQDYKISCVEQDMFDKLGIRACLNYGHTLAHAIEAAVDLGLGVELVPHGIAVACGMDFAAFSGKKMGIGNAQVFETQRRCLEKSGVWGNVKELLFESGLFQEILSEKTLLKHMLLDKKADGDKLDFVLLEDFGKPVIYPIRMEEIKQNLVSYTELVREI